MEGGPPSHGGRVGWGRGQNNTSKRGRRALLCLYLLCIVLFSPSGCTFWGKKPWSRKKRILSQMATLVGAPLGIALLAAIAGPALVIGLPAYLGHRVRS